MERNIKKRSASKNVVNGLVVEVDKKIDDKSKRREVERMIRTIETKMLSISTLNDSIIEEIELDKVEEDIDIATQFEISVMKEMDKFAEILSSSKIKTEVDAFVKNDPDKVVPPETVRSTAKSGVKLPKINIEKFYGDPIRW